MLELVIIRGLPGSGKTTLAKTYENHLHFEADLFMCDASGYYCFDPSLLHLCHTLCKKHTKLALNSCISVVVSNTFTTHKEMKPYLDIAEDANAEVKIIVCRENYGSIHNVPSEAIKRMKSRWKE